MRRGRSSQRHGPCLGFVGSFPERFALPQDDLGQVAPPETRVPTHLPGGRYILLALAYFVVS